MVCTRCAAPLKIASEGRGLVTLTCPRGCINQYRSMTTDEWRKWQNARHVKNTSPDTNPHGRDASGNSAVIAVTTGY